jgi:general secretion pathway protein C
MQLPKSLSRITTLAEGARAEGWSKSLPLLVSAVLVVLLAWQLVHLAWVLLGAGTPAGGPQGATAAAPMPGVNVPAIVNAHLFGTGGTPATGDSGPVAATSMSLVLVGTIANSDPKLGYAIIGESPTSAKVYAVGKTITGGTLLHEVYADRVILDRGGRLEALMLPKTYTGGGLNPPTAGPAPVAGDGTIGGQLRQMAAQNPAAITEIMRPQPVFANGQQRGYRVYPGRNRQQFVKLGLLPGDLVTAVNGTPLDDPNRGVEILQSMNSAASVTVTVERNGQTQQVTINNAQFAADAAAAAASQAVPVSEIPPTQPQDPSE